MQAAIFQYDVVHDAMQNLSKVQAALQNNHCDLLLLPELSMCGYLFPNRQELLNCSEVVPDGFSTQRMLQLSKEHQCTIVFGLAERESFKTNLDAALNATLDVALDAATEPPSLTERTEHQSSKERTEHPSPTDHQSQVKNSSARLENNRLQLENSSTQNYGIQPNTSQPHNHPQNQSHNQLQHQSQNKTTQKWCNSAPAAYQPHGENYRIYNTAVIVSKGRYIGKYRKIHLSDFEKTLFDRGSANPVFKIDGLTLGVQICFDLWFPEVSREQLCQGADLLCVLANFGGPTTYQISKIRAIENLTPLLMCNRVGNEQLPNLNADFLGKSSIINASGKRLWTAAEHQEDWGSCEIDFSKTKANVICSDFMSEIMLHKSSNDFKV